jgi:hypothetical protein
MVKPSKSNKAAVLFLSLFVLLLVVIFANVILNIMRSHSRLTHHQVSRIQGYYAAMAGVNYALEKLRLGTWTVGTYCINNSGPDCPGPCLAGPTTVNEPDFPCSVTSVTVNIGSPDGSGIYPVSAEANYRYTP